MQIRKIAENYILLAQPSGRFRGTAPLIANTAITLLTYSSLIEMIAAIFRQLNSEK